MNLEIKKQFRKESKADIIFWGEDNSLGYTEDYVNWLEKKLNTSNSVNQKEIKEGDIMEVVDEIYGHEFKIGTHVKVTVTLYESQEYKCYSEDGEYWYLSSEELSHIKTETK